MPFSARSCFLGYQFVFVQGIVSYNADCNAELYQVKQLLCDNNTIHLVGLIRGANYNNKFLVKLIPRDCDEAIVNSDFRFPTITDKITFPKRQDIGSMKTQSFFTDSENIVIEDTFPQIMGQQYDNLFLDFSAGAPTRCYVYLLVSYEINMFGRWFFEYIGRKVGIAFYEQTYQAIVTQQDQWLHYNFEDQQQIFDFTNVKLRVVDQLLHEEEVQ